MHRSVYTLILRLQEDTVHCVSQLARSSCHDDAFGINKLRRTNFHFIFTGVKSFVQRGEFMKHNSHGAFCIFKFSRLPQIFTINYII